MAGGVEVLLRLLADGRFHSGPALGQALGISRAAVWKRIQGLAGPGLEIDSVPGKGYRLAAPLELLDAAAIGATIDPTVRRRLHELRIHTRLESTNTHLMRAGRCGAPSGVVCLAEQQTAGRGRHGRPWLGDFGRNLYLSALWRYACGPSALSGLSLALGVVVARTLAELGVEVGLKWPNDLLWEGRKLGGILVEMAGESSGPCRVVAGIGLNLRVSPEIGAEIDQPWVDLAAIPGGREVSRNRLAGRLIHHLLLALPEVGERGLAPFLDEWRARDLLADQPVELVTSGHRLSGIARGVDDHGALRLETADGLRILTAGEPSLKKRPLAG